VLEKKKFNVNDWGGYAKCYDALNLLRPYQQLQQTVIASLKLLPGQIILDAATGTGNLGWWIQKGGGLNGARIIGVDFSEEMLALAGEKCEGMAVDFKKCDLNQSLPFADVYFHQIVSVNTLYALSDPEKILSEFHRVLKPGGRIILINPKKGYENGLILKAHCRDGGPDELWLDAHASEVKERELVFKAVNDYETAAKFLSIASFNREIAANRQFYFFEEQSLLDMFYKKDFFWVKSSRAYAGQAIAITARKGG